MQTFGGKTKSIILCYGIFSSGQLAVACLQLKYTTDVTSWLIRGKAFPSAGNYFLFLLEILRKKNCIVFTTSIKPSCLVIANQELFKPSNLQCK